MRTEWADHRATDLQKRDGPAIEESDGTPGNGPGGPPPSLADGRRPASAGWRGWRWVAVIAGVVAVALAAALVVAVIDHGSDEPRSQTTTSTAPPASSPSSTADTDAATPAPSPTPTVGPTTQPPAGPVLEDGRHAVFLTGLDIDARTVDFDVIQFLMGDEATAAYHEDHPEDPDAPRTTTTSSTTTPGCASCRSTRTSRSSFWTPSSRRRSPSRIRRPGWRATW